MTAMNDAGVHRPLLLQPISLRGIFARNRIVVSPMCQYHSQGGGLPTGTLSASENTQ
jgi:2,4-dienoyl-CoA reductase-like NADH-dependent reductase (Old Yellow Enzyme family)